MIIESLKNNDVNEFSKLVQEQLVERFTKQLLKKIESVNEEIYGVETDEEQ